MIRILQKFLIVLFIPILGHASDLSSKKFSSECSINLMWVNKSLDSRLEYVFPTTLPKFPNIKTTELLTEWCEDNPICQVNIWYDQNTVTPRQLQNTHDLLEELNLLDRIKLRDIWKLKTVQDNPKIFEEAVPFYYRIDLLRAIIVDELTNEGDARYGVYADINIPPFDHDVLFKEETQKRLDQYGFLLSKRSYGALSSLIPYENGFFILDGNNSFMKKAHRIGIIDVGINLGYELLKSHPEKDLGRWEEKHEQDIFTLYKNLLKIYFVLKGDLKVPIDLRTCNVGRINGMDKYFVLGSCSTYPQEETNSWTLSNFFDSSGKLKINIIEALFDKDQQPVPYSALGYEYDVHIEFTEGKHFGRTAKVNDNAQIVRLVKPDQSLSGDAYHISRILKDVAQLKSHFG